MTEHKAKHGSITNAGAVTAGGNPSVATTLVATGGPDCLLVPQKPTKEMIEAAYEVLVANSITPTEWLPEAIYCAMLSAVPKCNERSNP